IEAGPGASDFLVRECLGDKHAHPARDDFVSSQRSFGFNHVSQKRWVARQIFPHADGGDSSNDLVSQTLRLNIETFRRIGFTDWSPIHSFRGRYLLDAWDLSQRTVGYGICRQFREFCPPQ